MPATCTRWRAISTSSTCVPRPGSEPCTGTSGSASFAWISASIWIHRNSWPVQPSGAGCFTSCWGKLSEPEVMQKAKGTMQTLPRLGRSTRILHWHLALCILQFAPTASAQQLLDRVVARIGTEAITQTDVQAILEFGLIDAKSATDPDAIRQVVDRRLILREVARVPPPEPSPAAIEQQLSA